MYYVLWLVGVIASCLLSAMVGLYIEKRDSDNNQ